MAPRRRRGSLVYDLRFAGDDGAGYRLYGQKHAFEGGPTRGMTTLHAELTRGDAGRPVARGVVRFDMRDLFEFLATWRVRPGAEAQAGAAERAGRRAAYSESSSPSATDSEPSGSSAYSARSVSATGGS